MHQHSDDLGDVTVGLYTGDIDGGVAMTETSVIDDRYTKATKDEQCPSCGLKDGIRYLGSRVATLASVTLGQLFGSPDVAAAEKKTLVFTDSVQDASHRAAFVESRAYALNLRALLHRAIGSDGCTHPSGELRRAPPRPISTGRTSRPITTSSGRRIR
ncbi:MAG: hypothetical protein M3Q39_08125 [Actinomycetota bacterium]|nr:hypothetical protein [Actinomycetota bacterium]